MALKKTAIPFWLKTLPVEKSKHFFHLIIIAFCFIVYGNTIGNDYGMDDHLVTNHNELTEKGFGGLYQIFTTNYISESGVNLDYRPLVKATYAIEYAIWDWNPHVSHFINILLYALACCFILEVLVQLFGKAYFTVQFSGILLYVAHPVHTEVVASLKSRDEILVLLFIFISSLFFIKYSTDKNKNHFALGMFFFFLSLLSKITGIPFILIIPLMLYLKTKEVKIATLTFTSLAAFTAIYYLVLLKTLPGFTRPYEYVETPLPYITDWSVKLGTSLYSLLYYLKLLVLPVQLSFYYGINYIPLSKIGEIWPLLSLIIHLSLLASAFYFLKHNKFVSFFLFFYLIQVSPGSNILQPLPGIVGERILFTASISFCVVLPYLLSIIYNHFAKQVPATIKKPDNKNLWQLKINYLQGSLLIIVLLFYSFQTIARNKDWKDTLTLFEADMPHLQTSAKANYMAAKEIRRIYRTNKDLTQEEYDTQSAKAIHYYNQAIADYPGYALAIEELGMIYAIEQKNRSMAIPLFEKAFALDSTLWRSANNLAMALQLSADTAGAIKWYENALKAKADNPKVLVELGKLYYLNGDKAKALATNDTLQKLIPDSYLPYYNYGVYYMLEHDTLKAVHYFEEDIKKGERERFPYLFLIKHYLSKGDSANAFRVRKFAPRVSQ